MCDLRCYGVISHLPHVVYLQLTMGARKRWLDRDTNLNTLSYECHNEIIKIERVPFVHQFAKVARLNSSPYWQRKSKAHLFLCIFKFHHHKYLHFQ